MWSIWQRSAGTSQYVWKHSGNMACTALRVAPSNRRRVTPTSITRDGPSNTMRSTHASSSQ